MYSPEKKGVSDRIIQFLTDAFYFGQSAPPDNLFRTELQISLEKIKYVLYNIFV